MPPPRRTPDPPACRQNCGPPNPYRTRSREENLRSKRSYEELIADHKKKLEDYIRDPYAQDNLGTLRNAPNDAIRQRIIDGRIRELQSQIAKQEGELAKIIDVLTGQ